MLFMKTIVAATIVASVFVSLPTATKCNTSYYDRYYAARRYIPLRKSSQVPYNFTVRLVDETLASYERVAIVGDQRALGWWSPQQAVLLNRSSEHNVWCGSVQLPINVSVQYRYFIAAVADNVNVTSPRTTDASATRLIVRRWETHLEARNFNVSSHVGGNRTDIFGHISEDNRWSVGADVRGRDVKRGWLHAGRIIQFKLFRNPINIEDYRPAGERLLVKLQPIDANKLTPIMSSLRANTEYVRMEYGNSILRPQPEHGVPYNQDDIVIYHTTLADADGNGNGNGGSDVAYLLKIYAVLEHSDLVRLIGFQYIQPTLLKGTEGKLLIDLISPIWLYTVGSVELQYLVITPMPNASAFDFHTTFMEYWRPNWTGLDVGHRGLGKSLKQLTHIPAITENTLASMKAANALGADMVEFDVMLTSDLVPIIYHDYSIFVCMDPKRPKNKDDLTEVLIKDITYEQLKNLKTYQIIGKKIVEYVAYNIMDVVEQRLFPSLEDFLTRINKTLGFNIEIKWPQLRRTGTYESFQTIDKNTYVDRILDVMHKHGCGRLSFFTSFDADICTLLRYKQNMYPVMFLSSTSGYADPRSDTIADTINNAQAFDLAGIVPNADAIKIDTKWIQMAAALNKRVFVWGDAIKDSEAIRWFKDQSVTGVIYDRLDLWLPSNKRNVFTTEDDLPAFFNLQCAPQSTLLTSTGGTNSTIDSILSNVNLL